MLRKKVRAVFSFPVLLGALLLGWVFWIARASVADPDIWWHMENAKYLLAHHHFPNFDTFSFTTLGHPWMNHEWMAEIGYYLGWRALGLTGVYAVYLGILDIIFLAIFYLAYQSSGNLKGSWLASCFCVFLGAVSFGPRTLLYGYLYLLALLVIMQRFRAKGRAPLWLIPVVFCLWVNSHGSWLIGLVVFGTLIASGFVQGTWGRVEAIRWSPQQLRQLFVTAGASLAALFVNPFGYHLVYYPFDLAFRQKLTVSNIDEWASVDFHEPVRGKIVLIMLAALLVGALLTRHKWELGQLGLALLAVYSGLTYVRFLFLAAILLVPLFAKFLDFLPPYRPEIDKPLLNAGIIAAMLVIVVAHFPTQDMLENGVAERYPAAALAYVKAHGLPGRTLNAYTWGGYLVWKDPALKTFVDSRSDIYEYEGVLGDYLDLLGLKNSLKVLDKYQIRWVLFQPKEPFAYLLAHHPDWKVVYNDNVTEIFERVGPMPPPTWSPPSFSARRGAPEADKAF
jgi:hypothetical protein